jgi:hypothetical protein
VKEQSLLTQETQNQVLGVLGTTTEMLKTNASNMTTNQLYQA